VRCDRVGELGIVVDLARRAHDLGRDLLVELDVVLELGDHRAGERLDLDLVFLGLCELDGAGLVEFGAVRIGQDLGAGTAFDQHLDGAVRQLQELQHVGNRADVVDGFRLRIVVGGVDLGGKQNLLVGTHDFLERTDRLLTAHEQRHDHVRKDDDVAQRQDGIDAHVFGSVGRARFSCGHFISSSGPEALGNARQPLPRQLTSASTLRLPAMPDYVEDPGSVFKAECEIACLPA
jgi:hypothetical protein